MSEVNPSYSLKEKIERLKKFHEEQRKDLLNKIENKLKELENK